MLITLLSIGSIESEELITTTKPKVTANGSEILYLAKFKNASYLHVKWVTAAQVIKTVCPNSIQAFFKFNQNNAAK